MTRIQVVIAGVALASGAVAAQQASVPTPSVPPAVQIQQRRFQLQLMESVIENAVRNGAQEVALRAQELPIGMLFMGAPRAKGFPLEPYGLVFDVEIPQIKESFVMRSQMARSSANAPQTPQVGTQTVAGRGSTRVTGTVADDAALRAAAAADPFLADPNQFYRDVVKNRLVDAMLDFSRSLQVGAEEWLTIVARSEEDPIRTGLYEDSQTLILKIKGSDLALFHSEKLTRDEAKKRVIESQF
jgi:hypothetical protein